MTIDVENVGKRFDSQWIFKNVSLRFEGGNVYAITGKNGSGKSTLLKTLAGFLTPNHGTIRYSILSKEVRAETALANISFSSPYLELIEELTVGEIIQFHSSVRNMLQAGNELLENIKLNPDAEVRNLSSGMKQRLKLALAIFTKSEAIFLDEPTANFDAEWENWYVETLKNYAQNRLIVIASNHLLEYESFAKQTWDVSQWKRF